MSSNEVEAEESVLMDCSICGGVIEKEANGWDGGHNAWPINEGRCCGICNDMMVLPARLKAMRVNRLSTQYDWCWNCTECGEYRYDDARVSIGLK